MSMRMFTDWAGSDDIKAREYRRRIEAGEKGNPENPELAAMEAYEAGIDEGKSRAVEALRNLIQFEGQI